MIEQASQGDGEIEPIRDGDRLAHADTGAREILAFDLGVRFDPAVHELTEEHEGADLDGLAFHLDFIGEDRLGR